MVDNAGADYDPDFTFGTVTPEKEWFDVMLTWAREQIVDYLRINGKLDELAASCGCTSESIQDVCRLTPDLDGRYRCLADNSVYNSRTLCESACLGDVRLASNGGFCILADPSDPQSGALFGLRYNLAASPKPEEEKVFGDVEIGAGMGLFHTGEMAGLDSSVCGKQTVNGIEQNICSGTCEDTSYNEGIRTDTITGSCSASGSCSQISVSRDCAVYTVNSKHYYITCDGNIIRENYCSISCSAIAYMNRVQICNSLCPSYINYKCDRTGQVYNDNTSCTQACQQSTCSLPGGIAPHGQTYANNSTCQYSCNRQELHSDQSNRLVRSSAECTVPRFECAIDKSIYTSQAACAQSCSFEPGGAIQYGSCADKENIEDQIKFSLWLTPTTDTFGLDVRGCFQII
jgi:hypothetical protein